MMFQFLLHLCMYSPFPLFTREEAHEHSCPRAGPYTNQMNTGNTINTDKLLSDGGDWDRAIGAGVDGVRPKLRNRMAGNGVGD